MFEAYSLSVKIGAQNEMSPVLSQIIKQLGEAQQMVMRLNAEMKGLGKGIASGIAGETGRIKESIRNTIAMVQRANDDAAKESSKADAARLKESQRVSVMVQKSNDDAWSEHYKEQAKAYEKYQSMQGRGTGTVGPASADEALAGKVAFRGGTEVAKPGQSDVFGDLFMGQIMSDVGRGAVVAGMSPIVAASKFQTEMLAVKTITGATADEMDNLAKAIREVVSVTQFSVPMVGEIAKLLTTGLEGTPGIGPSQLTDLVPVYAKFADVMKILDKSPSYQTSTIEAMRMAHVSQHYSPQELIAYMDLVSKATQMMPGGLPEISTALKYFAGPAKQGLKLSDDETIMAIAFANRLGFAGSRGGTNLLSAAERNIPGMLGSGLLKGKSAQALKELGMLDASGHSKVFDARGHFDMIAWLEGLQAARANIVAKYGEKVGSERYLKDVRRAYGITGERLATTLSSPYAEEQWKGMVAQLPILPGMDKIQSTFANQSVVQQAINAQTNFTSFLSQLGDPLLPAVSEALSKVNKGFASLRDLLEEHPMLKSAAGWTALGGAVAGGALDVLGKGMFYVAMAKYIGLINDTNIAATKVIPALGGFITKIGLVGTALWGLYEMGNWIYEQTEKHADELSHLYTPETNAQAEIEEEGKKHFSPQELEKWKLGNLISSHLSSPGDIFKTVLETDWIDKVKNSWKKAGDGVEKSGDEASKNIRTSGESLAAALNYIAQQLAHLEINMDGRKVAEGISKYQAKEMNKPLGGAYNLGDWNSPHPGLGGY